MRATLCVALMCLATAPSFGQASSSKFEPGTIMAVTTHQSASGQQDHALPQYDVSIKVGNTLYVVLYTPKTASAVQYAPGLPVLVSVGSSTLKVNTTVSGSAQVPILRQETIQGEKRLDWSKLPSQYFSMKQEHLSEALDLTDDQRAKIKPTLEQEAGEAGQVLDNPALSRKDQLTRWEKIVRSSDAKLQPVLTSAQVTKLQEMRQEQKQELKRMIAQQGKK